MRDRYTVCGCNVFLTCRIVSGHRDWNIFVAYNGHHSVLHLFSDYKRFYKNRVGDFFWVFLGCSENVSRDFDKRGGGSGAEQHRTPSGALGGE